MGCQEARPMPGDGSNSGQNPLPSQENPNEICQVTTNNLQVTRHGWHPVFPQKISKSILKNRALDQDRPFHHSFQSAPLAQASADQLTPFSALIDMRCPPTALMSELGLQHPFERIHKGSPFRTLTFRARPSDIEELQLQIEDDPCIQGIGLNTISTIPSSENIFSAVAIDPLANEQDHLRYIKIDRVQDYFDLGSLKGRKAVIAIIDSGVDIDHEDLKQNLWTNLGESGKDNLGRDKSSNGIDDDGNGYVDDVYGYNFPGRIANPRPSPRMSGSFHGTHVAGLAAARSFNAKGIRGVMGQHIEIMSLNVFGTSSGAITANIDNAIRYAADNGADVINLSLGGAGYTQTTEAALKYAIARGVFVVAAAGNSSQALSTSKTSFSFDTPASFGGLLSGMFTVASVDTQTDAISSFSNFGTGAVEIAAPGAENTARDRGLLSTATSNSYVRSIGTSMASPVVSGAVGLVHAFLQERSFQLSPAQRETAILEALQSQSNLTSRVKDGKTLDLARLFSEMDKNFPIEVPNDPVIPDPTDPDASNPPPSDNPSNPGDSPDQVPPC